MTDPVITQPNDVDADQALLLAKLHYAREQALMELDNTRWRTRRRMAWICLTAIMLFTGVVMWKLPPSSAIAFSTVITWFYISTTSVIAAYVGASAFTYVASLRNPNSIGSPVDWQTGTQTNSPILAKMDGEVAKYNAQRAKR